MPKYNKDKIADVLMEEFNCLGYSGSRNVVDRVFELISDKLVAADKVSIAKFGVFSVKSMGPKVMRNPMTGAKVNVEAHIKMKFQPADALKKKINNEKI